VISESTKKGFAKALAPIAGLLGLLGLRPNFLTAFGFFVSVGAGYLFWKGSFPWAGLVLLASGLCDALDGALARSSNNVTTFGKFLDSTLDRYSEIAVFLGIFLYYHGRTGQPDHQWGELMSFLGLAASLMVSYSRARAEGLGEECKVGWMERPERILLLVAGALFGPRVFFWALLALVVLATFTALQRLFYIRKKTRPAPVS
jgi:CDP-diacylglycerol--glycerol-3-phosphate 3-phosphatidyltransferase